MPSRMNQYPDSESFSLLPDLHSAACERTLSRVLVPGNLMDSLLERYCCRLQERFSGYCSTCPVPGGESGLLVTPEIRRQAEMYLPMGEIRSAFRYLLRRSTCYEPYLSGFSLLSALSWPDVIAGLPRPQDSSNPARLLRRLAEDEDLRRVFVASALVPKRYGGEFGRYPKQSGFLREWLRSRRQDDHAAVTLLDAACGSGEQCYELVELLLEAEWEAGRCRVTGETIELLELVAGAHGWFPHDKARERRFRRRVEPILARSDGRMLSFVSRDIRYRDNSGSRYDVVVCNGLFGGPLLNDTARIRETVLSLTERVAAGGIFLAADHFHDGWRKTVPVGMIKSELESAGFASVDVGEGVAAVRL